MRPPFCICVIFPSSSPPLTLPPTPTAIYHRGLLILSPKYCWIHSSPFHYLVPVVSSIAVSNQSTHSHSLPLLCLSNCISTSLARYNGLLPHSIPEDGGILQGCQKRTFHIPKPVIQSNCPAYLTCQQHTTLLASLLWTVVSLFKQASVLLSSSPPLLAAPAQPPSLVFLISSTCEYRGDPGCGLILLYLHLLSRWPCLIPRLWIPFIHWRLIMTILAQTYPLTLGSYVWLPM